MAYARVSKLCPGLLDFHHRYLVYFLFVDSSACDQTVDDDDGVKEVLCAK